MGSRRETNGWTGGQYSLFRWVLGGYLLVHFLQLLPYGTEVFSNQGMLADAARSPLFGVFPNPLAYVDSPLMVAAFLSAGAGLSLCLAAGYRDRVAAVGLWFVLACLFNRNPLIQNPSLPYVGWILLAHACIPRSPWGAWQARGRTDPGGGWELPQVLFVGAWVLMALGYSYSGYTKLVSPSWVDGSAIRYVLENPLARPSFLREWLLALPGPLLQGMTWSALAMELSFAPLACFRRARPWLWLALLSMHLGLLALIDFADLSFGMVILHLFTFNPGWLRGALPNAAGSARDRLFYDGDCGMCHGAVRSLLAGAHADPGFGERVPVGCRRNRYGLWKRDNLCDSQ